MSGHYFKNLLDAAQKIHQWNPYSEKICGSSCQGFVKPVNTLLDSLNEYIKSLITRILTA